MAAQGLCRFIENTAQSAYPATNHGVGDTSLNGTLRHRRNNVFCLVVARRDSGIMNRGSCCLASELITLGPVLSYRYMVFCASLLHSCVTASLPASKDTYLILQVESSERVRLPCSVDVQSL